MGGGGEGRVREGGPVAQLGRGWGCCGVGADDEEQGQDSSPAQHRTAPHYTAPHSLA